MRRHLFPILAGLIPAAVTTTAATARNEDRGPDKAASGYAIGFWGDLPYSDLQKTTGVPNLIADMNRQRLAFTVHNSLRARPSTPRATTEWTDCDRANHGAYSSKERLEHIRTTLFDDPRSFGQRRMRREPQVVPSNRVAVPAP